jgi:hypothetical protein
MDTQPEEKSTLTSAEWKSCCFRLQPQLVTFMVQVTFSAFLILFAAFKLNQTTGPADPLWVSILTTTAGVWLPSPLQNSHQPNAPS